MVLMSSPLTLTLSLRRGNSSRHPDFSNISTAKHAVRFFAGLYAILPLPKGEGRGEGKENKSIPDFVRLISPFRKHFQRIGAQQLLHGNFAA